MECHRQQTALRPPIGYGAVEIEEGIGEDLAVDHNPDKSSLFGHQQATVAGRHRKRGPIEAIDDERCLDLRHRRIALIG